MSAAHVRQQAIDCPAKKPSYITPASVTFDYKRPSAFLVGAGCVVIRY
jgi:hypothetical protein